MKIQFIVCGWHYNQDSLISGLIKLEKENDNVNVFYSCHKEPTDEIKNNFKWKLYPNLGLGDGAYEQAEEYLNLEDDTICFYIHDDLIIKDWTFISKCIEALEHGFKIVGNCRNYPTELDPNTIREYGPIPKWDGRTLREYVKKENQHLFDKKRNISTIRGSFNCLKFKTLKEVGGWEPHMFKPLLNEKGNPYYRKEKGIGGLGNICLILFSYKFNVIFGHEKMAYLSNSYLDSPYIYECARGNIDPNNPIKYN
tara:strand:+ start:7118 stop:7879 length:762 start_codon:yes stop_codon:yes gene_type:complete